MPIELNERKITALMFAIVFGLDKIPQIFTID